MAVTMADITKLRKMSGAGMMDCKKALTESDGDIEKAMEIIRKKGQAIAAKRSDREAAEGCVLAKKDGEFAAIIALKCETDFVAKNEDFVALTQAILDAAVANKCRTLDEVKALPMGKGTIQEAVTDRSGITGEKMELDGYCVVEGAYTTVYNHMGKNQLCTIAAFNKESEEAAHNIVMQIAAMNPIAIDEAGVPESVKEKEIQVAIEKTKAEQVQKAVEAALKKAGINPSHVDSEAHMESNMDKGWITAEDVAKAKEIIATVSAEKAANLPQQMIENIAKGRLGKFLKEVCLLNQEDIMDGKKTVRETNADIILVPAVSALFERIANPELAIHRINISVNHVIEEEYRQYSMFTDVRELERNRKLQTAMLDIKKKFGKNAILKGINLQEASTMQERNQQIGGHKSGIYKDGGNKSKERGKEREGTEHKAGGKRDGR